MVTETDKDDASLRTADPAGERVPAPLRRLGNPRLRRRARARIGAFLGTYVFSSLTKRIVVLKWDAVPVLDAGGLDAFQRFVNKLPEGCELRVSNLEFQPLRTLARAGVKPLPGRLSFYPDRQAALADL